MEVLDDYARTVHERMIQTRRAMMVSEPHLKFFAYLLSRLDFKATISIPTAGCDGVNLWYNPLWIGDLSPVHLVFVMAHEVMHPAAGHHLRMENREPDRFNIAGDLAINPLLMDSGFEFLQSGIRPGVGKFNFLPEDSRWSAERYYDAIPDSMMEEYRKMMKGMDPGECGAILPHPDIDQMGDGEKNYDEQTWNSAVINAARSAYSRSNMPGELARLVDELVNPKTRWQDILREFVVAIGRDDYSWLHPSKRLMVAMDEILPGPWSEKLGHLLFSIDSSGSISHNQLIEFASQLIAVMELNPMTITIFFHHTDVYHRAEWKPGDDNISFNKLKGGGTSHVDVFREAYKLDNTPIAMIALTDLCTKFPDTTPDFPVLWAVNEQYKDMQIPFGTKVVID